MRGEEGVGEGSTPRLALLLPLPPPPIISAPAYAAAQESRPASADARRPTSNSVPGVSQARQSTAVDGAPTSTHSRGGKDGRRGPGGKAWAGKGLSTVLEPDRSSKWPRAMSSEMAARRAAFLSLSKSCV